MEDLAEKDATRKSDAAREAFLAELARDPQKGAAGFDILKTKERKKTKENRKNKDQKATHSYDLQDLTAGEMYVSLSQIEHINANVLFMSLNYFIKNSTLDAWIMLYLALDCFQVIMKRRAQFLE